MNISGKRDISIDIARGIGIILVVFGHRFPVYSITSYIYAFHIPLFFFLIGLDSDLERGLEHPWDLVGRYIAGLIIPYFLATACSYILYSLLSPVLSLPEIPAGAAARGIITGNGGNLPFNNILALLPAFFCGGVIFLFLALVFKGIRLFIASAIVSFAGIMVGISHQLPFGLDMAMTTQLFIYGGHLFREASWIEKIRASGKESTLSCIFPVALAAMVVFSAMNGRTDMVSRTYGQPVIFFITGISGSIAILMVSLYLPMKKHYRLGHVLEITGRAYMYIFISHIPVFYCIASVFALLWGVWIYDSFDIYWCVFVIIGLLIPTLAYMLVSSLQKKS